MDNDVQMLDDDAAPGGPSQIDGGRRPGRPRRGDSKRLYDHIIDTATRSFAEHGYAYTSMDQVAREAGTMRRSVMHRFAGKDALLLAVTERAVGDAVEGLVIPPRDNDEPLAHIRAVCRNLLDHATSDTTAGLFRVYAGEAARIPTLSDLIIRFNNELERRIERIVLDAQQSGAFRRFSASAIATAMIGMMLSNPMNRRTLEDEQFKDPHRVELYFSQMWAIFLAMS